MVRLKASKGVPVRLPPTCIKNWRVATIWGRRSYSTLFGERDRVRSAFRSEGELLC